MSPLPASELPVVDPAIWKACAGSSVVVPSVDDKYTYFPRGHVEQSSSPPVLSPHVYAKPCVICCVLSVGLHANPDTDEVCLKVLFQPLGRSRGPVSGSRTLQCRKRNVGDDAAVTVSEEENKVVSFAKILTPSDANNGGGFSVPRFCADSIFPPLDFQAEPPVQRLSLTDVQGVVWDFRHIYRGTPRRHLLTTGWSKFVNHKSLVAGDSVVFMKNGNGKLFIGVRRSLKSNRNEEKWGCPKAAEKMEEVRGLYALSKSNNGRIPAEAVSEAAELAAQGLPFEIVYYPRSGSSDFVVKADVVEEAMNVLWTPGMRVKMQAENDDSSKTTWLQGTVSSVRGVHDNGPWSNSPWRMLEVTWDESEGLQNVTRVSPWQVELVAPTPFYTTLPPGKRFRISQSSGLPSDGEGEIFFPMADPMMGILSPSLLNHSTFPAGMQGARQDSFCVSNISNITGENMRQLCGGNSLDNMATKLNTVSTDLHIGGGSQCDNLSPDSQSSVHFFGTKLAGNQDYGSPTKVGSNSFQLFGKIIHSQPPVEINSSAADCTIDNSKKYDETNCPDKSQDHSSTRSYMNLLDVQQQRSSSFKVSL